MSIPNTWLKDVEHPDGESREEKVLHECPACRGMGSVGVFGNGDICICGQCNGKGLVSE